MDLRQLAALVAVADRGTFSAAAESLHTVQSNVSTHIARLERELGATLVDRTRGCLTDEGRAVVERARRIKGELDALVFDVGAIRSDVRGRARLGVIGTTGRWLMPLLFDRLRERHPGVQLTAVEGVSTTLEPQLGSGGLDLAVVVMPVPGQDLVAEGLFGEDLVLIAPADHPLARRSSLALGDLDGHALLLPAPGTVLRAALDHATTEAGITLRTLAEIDGVRLVASLAFDGYGPAIVPATAIPRWVGPRLPWVTVSVSGLPRRHIGLATRRRDLLSAPARAVAAVLVEVVAADHPDRPGLHPPEVTKG